eukprot:366032-Chlamydomonas_euryale.AAC.3
MDPTPTRGAGWQGFVDVVVDKTGSSGAQLQAPGSFGGKASSREKLGSGLSSFVWRGCCVDGATAVRDVLSSFELDLGMCNRLSSFELGLGMCSRLSSFELGLGMCSRLSSFELGLGMCSRLSSFELGLGMCSRLLCVREVHTPASHLHGPLKVPLPTRSPEGHAPHMVP